MKKIGIIGAGPAGLMAALIAKNESNEVIIYEKNDSIGKKLLMTGGSRCNITNSAYYDEFLENVVTNKKFIFSAFTKFDNYALIDFLNQNRLQTTIEEDGRVFPKSEKASDVVDFFAKKLKEESVTLKTNTNIRKIYKDKFYYLTDQNNKTYSCDYLIIATGGKSYPNTGSDGYGYNLASKLGHNIIEAKPVLVPIYIKENLNLKAQSFRDIKIKIETKNNKLAVYGDLLINKNFLTGPAALKASSFLVDEEIKSLYIDFLPQLTYNDLDSKILNLLSENSKKTLGNALKELVNTALFEEILELLAIDPNIKASELNKKDRKAIINKINDFTLTFDRLGSFKSAIVTRGGVDLSQINPKNMESKIVDNLYFVGEILDIDSLTGGYNLQTYISTAYAAGISIKENT